MSEQPRDLPWRCFHCDEVFHVVEDARRHFGLTESDAPGCVTALLTPQKTLLAELQDARESLRIAESAVERLDYVVSQINVYLPKFGVSSLHGAWTRFREQQLDLRQHDERLLGLLRTLRRFWLGWIWDRSRPDPLYLNCRQMIEHLDAKLARELPR